MYYNVTLTILLSEELIDGWENCPEQTRPGGTDWVRTGRGLDRVRLHCSHCSWGRQTQRNRWNKDSVVGYHRMSWSRNLTIPLLFYLSKRNGHRPVVPLIPQRWVSPILTSWKLWQVVKDGWIASNINLRLRHSGCLVRGEVIQRRPIHVIGNVLLGVHITWPWLKSQVTGAKPTNVNIFLLISQVKSIIGCWTYDARQLGTPWFLFQKEVLT